MIYWFKNLPSESRFDKLFFPVVKYQWFNKYRDLLANILGIIMIVIFDLSGGRNAMVDLAKMLADTIPVYLIVIGYIIFVVAILAVHEFLHIVAVLGKGDISLTFNSRSISFWVSTNANLSKSQQFGFISLPLIALTIVPFFLSFFLLDDIAYILRFISGINLVISVYDILYLPFIIVKPKNAIFWGNYYYLQKLNENN